MTGLRAAALALLAITVSGCAAPISRHPQIAERVKNLIPVVDAITREQSSPAETSSALQSQP